MKSAKITHFSLHLSINQFQTFSFDSEIHQLGIPLNLKTEGAKTRGDNRFYAYLFSYEQQFLKKEGGGNEKRVGQVWGREKN